MFGASCIRDFTVYCVYFVGYTHICRDAVPAKYAVFWLVTSRKWCQPRISERFINDTLKVPTVVQNVARVIAMLKCASVFSERILYYILCPRSARSRVSSAMVLTYFSRNIPVSASAASAKVWEWEWINNCIPHFTWHVTTYPCWD